MSEAVKTTKEPYKIEDGELVESGTMTLTNMPKDLSPIEQMEMRIKLMEMIPKIQKAARKTALSCTRPNDWRLWNQRLRPEFSAASSIASTFGIRVTDVMREKRPTNNGYQIIMEATFELPMSGFRMESVQGSARSDDDIVATRYDYNPETKQREKKEIPSTDVDEATVSKKAYANMMVNGVMSVFGLRNVTEAELKEAGLNMGGGPASVEHSKKAWEASDAQKRFLAGLHATEAEIDACKSNADVTNLSNKLKAEKRKAPPAAAAPAAEAPADATAAIVDNLYELAQALGYDENLARTKVAAAKEKGLDGLKSLQQAWAELCRAKKG